MRKIIESTFVSLDGVIDDTRPSTASLAEPQHWGQPYWDEDQHPESHHPRLRKIQ